MQCDCPYCIYSGDGRTLPLPVRIPLHPFETLAAWGWLTNADEYGSRTIVLCSGQTYRAFTNNLPNLVTFTAREFDRYEMTTNDTYLERSITDIRVWGNLTLFDARLPMGNADPPPHGYRALHCFASTPVDTLDAPSSPRAPTKRRRVAPPPPPPPEPTRSPPRVAPPSSTHDGAYDVAGIGGNVEEVRRVTAVRPEWDPEVVLHILRKGAKPPLVRIINAYERAHFTELECQFRAPNGNVVSGVMVSLSLMYSLYPSAVVGYLPARPDTTARN